ncbi:hypothetical protein OXX69_006697 [Metschnikowia pulcherrima]
MSQQEIIDLAVASYLKTNDNTARQYLKLRQEALEVSQQVRKEVVEAGCVTPETALKLKKLKFENAKSSLVYEAYIASLTAQLKENGDVKGYISAKLNERYEDLVSKKRQKDEATDKLRSEHKPVIEKMRVLASKFEAGVSVRRSGYSRDRNDIRVYGRRDSAPDDESTLLDYASAVFSRGELEQQLADVESKLASLRTVDEVINKANSDGDIAEKPDQGASIDLVKYLDEILRNGRAYLPLEGSKYHYDVTKSSSADLGGAKSQIRDYEAAISTLTKEIQGLVARGTEAKERWIRNAQKMEMIHALLQEDMEIDG